MSSGNSQESGEDSHDYSSGGDYNDENGKSKDEPATPYSLRRTKHPPTRYGSVSDIKSNTSKSKSKSSSSQKISPSYRNSNTEDRDEESAKYKLRPRSNVSYREPENFDGKALEGRYSPVNFIKPRPKPRVVLVENENRPGLRPRKVTAKEAKLHNFSVLHPAGLKSKKDDGSDDDEGGDESEDEEERGRSGRSNRSRRNGVGSGSDSESEDESDSGSEIDESGGESGNERESESGGLSEKERKKKKAESPKKSEVRRSKRARISPKRYNPLTEQGANGSHARPRIPNFPRTWSGDAGGGGGKSRYYSRLGYDTDSSSSEDLPRNLPSLRMGASIPQPINLPRSVAASGKADTTPINVDRSVNWESVGGLNYHIQQLKEMILLPLLYPEVFNRFNVTPPKGVLFYGPPGTGKTLMARALANSCSEGGKQVSFFMRKGADCLSKWVGEAERQLRLLFEQARNMQPAIIFFDEIDGLAPVRSSKQDQIHSSIVSTLLALMDGLDNRGTVIVIGATNRLDSIDPALRRPGRFDREFLFTLPDRDARKEILNIHTQSWTPPLQPELVDELAGACVGYCGADVKSLCTEAVLVALRQRYPQIYDSKEKLKINLDAIRVEKAHFQHAMRSLIPASHRSALVHAIPLATTHAPLLAAPFAKLLRALQSAFPVASLRKTKEDLLAFSAHVASAAALPSAVYRPRLLLSGLKGMGQSQLGAALLHHLEEFPIFALDLPSLLSDPSAKSVEEAGMHVLSEAKRVQPCVVFVPHIDAWWEDSEYTVLRSALLSFLQDLDPSFPMLLFATADRPTVSPAHHLSKHFPAVVECTVPTKDAREAFFASILADLVKVQPLPRKRHPLKVLAKASAPAAEIGNLDEKAEEHILRQFRMVVRDVLHKMLDDRKFYFFAKDLSHSQYPEYYQIIRNPISLSTLLQRCDADHYIAPSLLYNDLDTFMTNTVTFYSGLDDEYQSQRVISRARALQDSIIALIEEIDPGIRNACEAILAKRGPRDPPAPRSQPMISPSSNEHPTRRSSARLRGEKAPPSLESPHNHKKPKREEEDSDEESDREKESQAETDETGESEAEGEDKRGGSSGDRKEDIEASKSEMSKKNEAEDEIMQKDSQDVDSLSDLDVDRPLPTSYPSKSKEGAKETRLAIKGESSVSDARGHLEMRFKETELEICGDADPALLLSLSEKILFRGRPQKNGVDKVTTADRDKDKGGEREREKERGGERERENDGSSAEEESEERNRSSRKRSREEQVSTHKKTQSPRSPKHHRPDTSPPLHPLLSPSHRHTRHSHHPQEDPTHNLFFSRSSPSTPSSTPSTNSTPSSKPPQKSASTTITTTTTTSTSESKSPPSYECVVDLIEQKKRREQARSKSDDESDASSSSKNSSKEPSHKTSHKKSYHKKQSHKNGSSKSHKKKTREPAKKMNGHHESDAMSEDSDGSKRTTKTTETEETTNTDINNNNTRQPTKPINNPSPDKDERMEDMEKDQERAEEQALETDKRKEVEEENEEEQEEEEQIEEEEVIQPVVDLPKMEGVVRELVAKTENFSVEELVQIHATIYAAMRSHHASADKSPLVQELTEIVKSIKPL